MKYGEAGPEFRDQAWRAPCYVWWSMKRIKKTDLKKLSIDVTTIRILSDAEQQQVVGGISGAYCSGEPGCGKKTHTCSVMAPCGIG